MHACRSTLEDPTLLGLAKLGARDLDAADMELSRSYAWHPEWPVAALALANVAMTGEDFERALDFYDKALALEPHAVDALIGKVQALAYLGRYEMSIAAADVMLAERWNLGSARYWRAFDELQLGRLDQAWDDVGEADRLLFNAAVPKLAGLIAYRRQQIDLAREKFEASRARDSSDCETGYYLGQVLAEQRAWARTAAVFIDAAQCLVGSVAVLNADIARIRNSDARPERKVRAIERREQQIASLGRMRATSSFNTAVAFYNLSRGAEARPFAELVANDEQFGERARDLLSRLR